MIDNTNNQDDSDLWLSEGIPSPEASQCYCNEFVIMSNINKIHSNCIISNKRAKGNLNIN